MSRKVVVLSTGGTIASAPAQDGRNISGALQGAELVSKIELDADIEVEVRSLFQKPSNAITFDDAAALRQECLRIIEAGQACGIVITHGTDTLEDTAYYLESSLDAGDVAVVVTGSQRVPHAMGTDAYVNLKNAILTAGSGQAHGLGVLVVFNETIFSACHVRKVSSYQLNGFDAPGYGFLGLIDQGTITLYQKPVRQQPLLAPAGPVPEVDIIPVYLDARVALLDAAIDAGAKGLVIDAVGRGHVPPTWMPSIRRAVAGGVTVVVCTSSLHGPVYQAYEFPGSLHDQEAAGAIGISGLSARKTRIRLALALASGHAGRAAILDAFGAIAL